jgi:hypothetical protein
MKKPAAPVFAAVRQEDGPVDDADEGDLEDSSGSDSESVKFK